MKISIPKKKIDVIAFFFSIVFALLGVVLLGGSTWVGFQAHQAGENIELGHVLGILASASTIFACAAVMLFFSQFGTPKRG